VAQLVGDDPQGATGGTGETGGGDGVAQAPLDAGRSETPTALDEDEVRETPVARMGASALRWAVCEPLVESFDSDVVHGHGPFVV